MYVKRKNKTITIALLGVMAALSTVLTVLGTVISVNTVFFTALAAFLVGIVKNQYGTGYGILFYVVCGTLDFLCNPNPLHVFLYLVLAGYILLSEITYTLLRCQVDRKERVHRVVRILIFSCCYLPLVFYVPQLVLSEKIVKMQGFWIIAIGVGAVAWLIYDMAYGVFKSFFLRRFANIL